MAVSFPLQISVIIPVYNAAKFIEAAVASCLQFEEVREVVLVDDAGPDNSLEVCQAMAAREPRVKLFRHPGHVNKGAAESRNLGILNSSSELLAFLDADDFFLPERFDAERRIFREHPDADGVYGAIGPHYYDEAGRALFNRTFTHEITTVRKRVPPEKLFEGLSGGIGDFGHFSLDALTVKRSVVMGLGRLMRKEIHLHEDTDITMRLAWHARLYAGSIDRPVTMRGVHAENRITQNDRLAHTQHMLYKCLWEWAVEVGVDADATERFHFKYRLNELRIQPSPAAALKLALGHRRYLGRYDFRDALLQRWTGADTKATRVMHGLIGRLVS
jgi:glycosyltransferase involved in cell wall biosynthesis